jgi:hypothetical protein
MSRLIGIGSKGMVLELSFGRTAKSQLVSIKAPNNTVG